MSHLTSLTSLSFSSAVAVICQVVRSKFVAIYLGPVGVGVLSQLKQFSNLMEFILGLGFYNGLIRHVGIARDAEDETKIREQISTVLLIVGLLAFTGTLVCLFLTKPISRFLFGGDESNAYLVFLSIFSIPGLVLARIYKGLLAAYRQVKSLVVAQISAELVGSILTILGLIVYGLSGAVLAFVAYQFVRFGLLVLLFGKQVDWSKLTPQLRQFRWTAVKNNLGYGLVSFIVSPVNALMIALVSSWIIAEEGIQENGIFVAAWTVSSVYMRLIYESASSYLFPVLAAAKDDEVASHMEVAIRLYVIGASAIIVILGSIGSIVISLLYSPEFVAAFALLVWMLPSDLFRIIGETAGLSLYAKQYLGVYMAIFALKTILFVGLAYWLIPKFGAVGAAYSYVTAQVASSVGAMFCSYNRFKITPSPNTIAILVKACSVAVIVCLINGCFSDLVTKVMTLVVGLLTWIVLFRKTCEFDELTKKCFSWIR